MKKGTKKFTANAENFNTLQMLRYCIKDEFDVSNVKWGGTWNGLNWGEFSFYCSPGELEKIKTFCCSACNQFNISFS